ncbi:hypothetical protein DFJ73DRAFT_846893 [Zopfochytrium polystomum]|nr:hypothetical protein DFJ73DRAFT_846893 [Zopfochytrium polystomum]
MAAGCRICGAKVKRKGGGLLVCRSGHVQQGAQEQVTESVGLFARRTRRVRRIKVRRLRPRGYLVVTAELFLEAYQYSLRSLSEELVRKKGLPSSFPETVLDIWLFFVSHQQKDRHGKKDGTPSFNGALRDVDRLVFLLLACNAMRIPATCADFARWAETGTIRYLNWMDILPPSLKSSFSVADLALRTSQKSAPPNAREIRRRMILVRERFERWGFLFQEANVEGVAARIVRTIGLPPELYVCMMTLHELHELHGRFASLENNDLTVSPVDADVYLLAIAFVCIKICYNLQSATMEDESRFAFVVRLAKSLRLNSVLDAIGPRMTAEELDSTYFGFIGAYMDMAERDVFSKEMPSELQKCFYFFGAVRAGF